MNKEIVRQVSSGGFIFFEDKTTLDVFVLLIKHKNGEIWIPKGKLEQGESQVDAAFREIKEEVGIGYEQLRYIDFCGTDSYGYDLDEKRVLVKELFINVFSVDSKLVPNPTDWNDLESVDWYSYHDALNVIAFNKLELERAYEIFIKSVNQVNRLITIAIDKLSGDISQLPCANNITSLLLYGSIYKRIHKVDIHDTDVIIVVKDAKVDMAPLFSFLHAYFENLDFFLYTSAEVENDLAFFSREFVLEYLAKGLCVYGDNVFQEQFKKVTRGQYVESMFIRSIAYVQMVRQVYYSNSHSFNYKITYLKKYITRLARCIILMRDYAQYDELERMSSNQILTLLFEKHHLTQKFELEGKNPEPIEFYFRLFCDLGENLHEIGRGL